METKDGKSKRADRLVSKDWNQGIEVRDESEVSFLERSKTHLEVAESRVSPQDSNHHFS